MKTFSRRIGAVSAAAAIVLASCAQPETPPHLRPLTNDAMMLLGKMGLGLSSPIFIRIYKEESELEVWKLGADGRYYLFKVYPICNWSGELGPKQRQGDRQAPEGFYTVAKHQMNPNSGFHLAFNLGYPNAFDKSHRRSGDFLMVHGKCRSAGCYAMTDALIEEIYALAREAFAGGQEAIHVHAFPFRMTTENMQRHRANQWYGFWQTLKEGHDFFETARQVPEVVVCDRRYNVSVRPKGLQSARLDPEARCPTLERIRAEPFVPSKTKVAEERVVAPGPRMRAMTAGAEEGAPRPVPKAMGAGIPVPTGN